MVILTLT